MSKHYIFTEIVGCGKIGKKAIDSFNKHHDLPVHIYGTKDDFKHISEHKNNVFIEVSTKTLNKFKLGHWGTAHLWDEIIKKIPSTNIIHFDSDVIFRDEIVNSIIKKSEEGFDLIGSRRNYYSNKNNRNDVRFIIDLCQTSLILFNKDKISKKYLGNYSVLNRLEQLWTLNLKTLLKNIKWSVRQIKIKNFSVSKLCKMIHGTYTPFSFPNIDFFDPVMIDMINNGAKIYYLDPTDTGTEDFYGKSYSIVANLDIGTKLAHFSGVGSGLNFTNNPEVKSVSESYQKHCIDKYKLFCRIFYGEYREDTNLYAYNKEIININKWY